MGTCCWRKKSNRARVTVSHDVPSDASNAVKHRNESSVARRDDDEDEEEEEAVDGGAMETNKAVREELVCTRLRCFCPRRVTGYDYDYADYSS